MDVSRIGPDRQAEDDAVLMAKSDMRDVNDIWRAARLTPAKTRQVGRPEEDLGVGPGEATIPAAR